MGGSRSAPLILDSIMLHAGRYFAAEHQRQAGNALRMRDVEHLRTFAQRGCSEQTKPPFHCFVDHPNIGAVRQRAPQHRVNRPAERTACDQASIFVLLDLGYFCPIDFVSDGNKICLAVTYFDRLPLSCPALSAIITRRAKAGIDPAPVLVIIAAR